MENGILPGNSGMAAMNAGSKKEGAAVCII